MLLDVEQALTARFPGIFTNQPQFITRPLIKFFRMILHEREINHFLAANSDVGAFEFIARVLDYFSFGYTVSSLDQENIPASGRLIIIANHPLGALDAMALIRMVSTVRRDLKVVANDLLMNIEPVRSLLLPVDTFGGATRRDAIVRINESLERDEAIIFFPAGEVARAGLTGIHDGRWKSGFLRVALKCNSPLLPIQITARNSLLFYGLSFLYKPFATLLLVDEMFKQRGKIIHFQIGEPIPARALQHPSLTIKTHVRLIRRHCQRVFRGKQGLFVTERVIAYPEDRRALKREIASAQLLGKTPDEKLIYLFVANSDSALLREIGRLRELAFRAVGEGTGKRRDIDNYDTYYQHIVLWDADELEVIGAYRIAEAKTILARYGLSGLYIHSLFELHSGLTPFLESGLELGRSFVQPRYWGSRALDYLWQGIGAYLKIHPEVLFLFGPVSISHSYPPLAKALLVNFYRHYFGDLPELVVARNPYRSSATESEMCKRILSGTNYETDFRTLKKQLAELRCTIPTLYKQYSDLCEAGGVHFLDFSIDSAFQECIDGFLLVEVEKIKQSKRQRYINPENNSLLSSQESTALSTNQSENC